MLPLFVLFISCIILSNGEEVCKISETTRSIETADVIVVGGGVSGMFSALELHKKGKSVIVLEARDRLGGRTFTKSVKLDKPTSDGRTNITLDFGGMWMGVTQYRLQKLVKELGIKYYPTPLKGKNVNIINGARSEYEGLVPSGIGILGLLEADYFIKWIDKFIGTLNGDPWTWENAKEYDSYSLDAYMAKNFWSKEAFLLNEIATRTIFALEPNEISYLYFLHYVKSSGSYEGLCSIENGAQQWIFEGGAQQLSTKMAQKLEKNAVRLGHPVSEIKYSNEGAEVYSGNKVFKAKRVIVATSPKMTQFIKFSPTLPGSKCSLHQRMAMGSAIKVHLVYEKPWWRDFGYTGQAVSDEGPLSYLADEGYPDGYQKQDPNASYLQPSLVGFIVGKHALSFGDLAVEERRKAVLNQVSAIFQNNEHIEPLLYTEYDWRQDEWAGGCYVAVMGTGILSQYGPYMRSSVGPIHWASTELATEWSGYIDGAIQSGERAAQEVMAGL